MGMRAEADMEKVQALAGKVIGDVAGAMSVFMAYLESGGVFLSRSFWPGREHT